MFKCIYGMNLGNNLSLSDTCNVRLYEIPLLYDVWYPRGVKQMQNCSLPEVNTIRV